MCARNVLGAERCVCRALCMQIISAATDKGLRTDWSDSHKRGMRSVRARRYGWAHTLVWCHLWCPLWMSLFCLFP